MKKTFMWYYAFIYILFFTIYGFWEGFMFADSDAFWLFIFTAPIAIWLFTSKE
jgi:hypothetical protein